METTLEVRWFIKGTPPAAVQRWFELECPGELLAEKPEVREDLYDRQKPEDVSKFQAIAPYITHPEAINLKLREGNLELKLRQHNLGTQQFNNAHDRVMWTGNIERWHKLSQPELIDSGLLSFDSIPQANWICVFKKRVQKIERDVKIELTRLKIEHQCWWSMAFEMTQECDRTQQDNCFQEVIQRACQSYYGSKLLADNSYSYSRWLLLLD